MTVNIAKCSWETDHNTIFELRVTTVEVDAQLGEFIGVGNLVDCRTIRVVVSEWFEDDWISWHV